MLTADELFVLPGRARWNHLVTRLAAETFQTDAGDVLVDGSRVNVIAAIADGIAHALLSERMEDIKWRSELLDLIMTHQEKPIQPVLLDHQGHPYDGLAYDYLSHGRYTFRNSGSVYDTLSNWSPPSYQFLAPHIAEKSIGILEKWVDVYAENKDPMQHCPKLSADDIKKYILLPLMRMPTVPFDGVIMRLVDRMFDLGIWWFQDGCMLTPVPAPVQQNLLFVARTLGQIGFMHTVFHNNPPITDGGVLAEAFLKALIRSTTPPTRLDVTYSPAVIGATSSSALIDFGCQRLTIHKTMDLLLNNNLPTAVSHTRLEDLAHEMLTVWLRAFESNNVVEMYRTHLVPLSHPVYILRQLVLTYYIQAFRAHKQLTDIRKRAAYYITRNWPPGIGRMIRGLALRFDPDPELMRRARTLMLSFDGECWPEGTMPRSHGTKFWS